MQVEREARRLYVSTPGIFLDHTGGIEEIDLDSLESLSGPYDVIFIDADKSAYPDYYELTVPMLAERGLIIADNAVE